MISGVGFYHTISLLAISDYYLENCYFNPIKLKELVVKYLEDCSIEKEREKEREK